jgi:hypothetical protein
MKGTGAAYGMPRVSEVGAELERAAHDEDTDKVSDLVDRLIDAVRPAPIPIERTESGLYSFNKNLDITHVAKPKRSKQ